jgi:uncharacterized protein YneF (UPF0154 family)
MNLTLIVSVIFVLSLLVNIGLVYYIDNRFIPNHIVRNHPAKAILLITALLTSAIALVTSTVFLIMHLMMNGIL